LNLAEAEAGVLVTLGKDFWQIALQRRVPLVRAFIEAGKDWPGHISTVTGDGIQMVPSRRG
jgi:hypothetical protein